MVPFGVRRPQKAGLALVLAALAAVCLPGAPAVAEVKVAALIGDHMVVQQGKPVHLWGTAGAGESVHASMAGAEAATRADEKGSWSLALPAMNAGGPHALSIRGTNALTFADVWAGEVWVASGQSNMEFPLSRAIGAKEAAAAGCPGLRLFTVAKATSLRPKDDVSGQWAACDASTAAGFSAVAFYFGQELRRALGVTVGLVHSSWGGTPAEAWTSRAALRSPARSPQPEMRSTRGASRRASSRSWLGFPSASAPRSASPRSRDSRTRRWRRRSRSRRAP